VADRPTPDELDAFCDALVVADAARSREFFEALRQQGKSPDTLSLNYIAPAARRLGERWISDDCSFLEVTLGSSRLHGLQRSLRRDFSPAGIYEPPEHRALFTVTPGDTHALGVTIAADFFRRAGWTVDLHTSPEIETLLAQASLGDYTLLGISVSNRSGSARLEDVIHRLRSLQPNAALVLGGDVSDFEPALVERLGVDALVEDVTTAPFWLKNVVKSAQNH
jgi:methanogenic corrinoid protein MtbC1